MGALAVGVFLIVLGIVIALFGEKDVDPKGGSISRLFSMPRRNVKAVKWGAAVSLIVLGVVLMLGVDRL